ncbi:hypothetical protein YTPLAS72_12500 [Nitrospira sp.]|nr:hypothetical protein YTPLAS72_12500 [Nitrospira sp.]
MVCQRCRGFLVCETFDELSSDTDSLHTRCINCGCVEDAVVRTNRLRPLRGMRATLRGGDRKGDGARVKVPLEESTLVR